MKIKKFESFIIPGGDNLIYYTLHINGSWDKFLIALDKLGVRREQFLNDWNIEDISDLSSTNAEYFKKDTIVFLIKNQYFYIRNVIDDFYNNTGLGKILYNHEKLINGGDVYVEDWEVTSNKYNL